MFVDQWQLCNGLSETTLHSHQVATVLHMVKRISDDGKSSWHEPPFTKEEEEDLYRRWGRGPVTVLMSEPRRKDEERE